MARLMMLAFSAAAGAAASQGGLAPKCATLLEGVAASGHSDTEIAAFCRAAYTPEMCGTMRASLGRMPWPAGKIQATCQSWDVRIKAGSTERDLMSYQDFQKTLEASAEEKAKYGYQMPRHRDGTVDLDKTAKMKAAQTQNITKAYYGYMGWTTTPEPKPMWGKTGMNPPSGWNGKWSVGQGALAGGAAGLRSATAATACGLLAMFAVVAGVVVGLKRIARRRQQGVALIGQGAHELEEAQKAEAEEAE